jgi:hypothetical protein
MDISSQIVAKDINRNKALSGAIVIRYTLTSATFF